MEVNKEQAEKCKTIGASALKEAQYDRAVKFFKKSLHLYPLPGVEALLSTAERMAGASGGSSSSSSSNHTNGASSSTSSSFNGRASASASSSSSTARSEASARAPASDSNLRTEGGRSYTPAMVETVERILKAKEGGRGAHYRIMGIAKDATEKEIKKAYRKIAIKVHPDKNSAPKADEAFKAIGLAYATLSDPQKRTIYDRYGEEDPDNRGGGMGGGMRRGPGGVHFRGGQDVNPEDIFNMFFGGGMGGGGMHRGPGGVHFSSNFGGMPFRQQHQQQQRGGGQPQQEAPGLANLIQLLPLLIILLLSFFNIGNQIPTSGTVGSYKSPGLNKYFALSSKDPFNNPLFTKLTKVKDIPYFVDANFLRTHNRDRYNLAQVERMVERAYENYLVEECNGQRRYKKSSLVEAQKKPTQQEIDLARKTAEKFELTRCVELNDLFPLRNSGRRY